jgi:protocatechuate 3,4-dioxygenase beta subunit
MNRTLLMATLLLLSACAAPIAPTISSATPQPTSTAGSSTAGGSATSPAVTATATTDITAAATGPDLFSENDITLATPVCDGTLTPELTEGPYYKSGSPEAQIVFQDGMPGTKLIVVGYVLDANCNPIPGAWLDFWQADGSGSYDNQAYTLRGHQYTDDKGRYFLETVVPADYPARTQHIHVKVQAPGGQVITSQLFFPGSPRNSTDNIYTPATQVTIEDRGDYQIAYYNFVLSSN